MEARAAAFVGRVDELAELEELLAPSGPRGAYVFGPGGIGKSSLLQALSRSAKQRGHRVATVDAEHLGPSTLVLAAALESALPEDAEHEKSDLWIIDTGERIDGLDAWLRHSLIPHLPKNTRFVVATRDRPSIRLISDPGLVSLVRVVGLRALKDDDCVKLLEQREVPPTHHASVLDATHGHPLALTLAADASKKRNADFDYANEPNIVSALLRHLLSADLEQDFRHALEACALARTTTEALLRSVLERDDTSVLYQWLQQQSYISNIGRGLAPHAVVRDAVSADLMRRDPQRFEQMHRALHAHYRDQDPVADLEAQIMMDVAFLHRRNSTLKRLFSFEPNRLVFADRAAEVDFEACRELDASPAHLARLEWAKRHWESDPGTFTVFRNDNGAVVGFESVLTLRAEDFERAEDPAVIALGALIGNESALRDGESLQLTRAWAQHGGQIPGDVQSQMWLHRVLQYGAAQGLAISVTLFAQPAFWKPAFDYMGFRHTPALNYEAGDDRGGGFVRDWRVESMTQWSERLARQAMGNTKSYGHASEETPRLIILSRDRFAAAVKRALDAYPERAALTTNPLTRSRLVVGRDEPAGTPAEQLAELLEDAIDRLRTESHRKAHAALMRTFITPAPTQALAAERLGIPFSTYRRHLKKGIDLVTAHLWELELGG